MHVYFVLYHRFDNASGIHIFHLANELQKRGIACTALAPDTPESVLSFGEPAFKVETFKLGWRSRIAQRFAKRGDSIVHAWTPREVTRKPTLELAARLRSPYLIHLEDNERDIYLAHAKRRKAGERGKRKVSDRLIHPLRWRQYMRGAAGVTALVDDLLEFCPAGTPGEVFWPACEPAIFDMPTAPDRALQRSVGIPEDAIVLYYPGNVHAANVEDVQALYRAIQLLNARGLPVWMLRTGTRSNKLGTALPDLPQIIELGHQPSSRIPEFLGVSDILVQPGRADRFNAYRFPSKLPMFLASGRPVVLPGCNLGRHLTDGRNCLLTRDGTAEELCEKIALLVADPSLRERLGTAGREFARHNLRWDIAADRMVRFYESILAAR
jgi:glycosyltransferase involved in cell wall biosynthesis